MKNLQNPQYNNLHISILENNIQTLFSYKIKKKFIRTILDQTLLPCITNINNRSHIFYDLTNNKDSAIYLDEYINTIVRILFSFNGFLLNFVYQYCEKNKINYYSCFPTKNNPKNATNKSLIEKQNNRNTITELLIFLYSQKIIPYNFVYTFSLYENIFRNQHAHGWSLFFYQLLKVLPNTFTFFNYKNNDFQYILTNSSKRTTHIDIRKRIKLRSLKKNDPIDLLPYIEFHPSDTLNDIDDELVFNVNNKLNPKAISSLKKHGIDTTYEMDGKKIDILDYYKANKGAIKHLPLRLQHLASQIFLVIESINEKI